MASAISPVGVSHPLSPMFLKRLGGGRTLELNGWRTVASSYQEEQAENFCIGRHIYKPGHYKYPGMDGYRFFRAVEPITITTLREFRQGEWNTWMVDTPPDYRAMQKYAERASGRVLTTGLGLGLIVHELCENDKVEDITVVERSPSVITLIQKYLPQDDRISLECDDFWRFVMLDDTTWDDIVVDLWVFHNLDMQIEYYLKEVVPLSKQLGKKYPDSRIVFHGFAGMPTKEDIIKSRMGGDVHTNELIWGLKD